MCMYMYLIFDMFVVVNFIFHKTTSPFLFISSVWDKVRICLLVIFVSICRLYCNNFFHFILNCSYLFAVYIIWCCLNKCDCGGDQPLFKFVWRYIWRYKKCVWGIGHYLTFMLYWSAVGCFTAGLHHVDFESLLQL